MGAGFCLKSVDMITDLETSHPLYVIGLICLLGHSFLVPTIEH